VATGCDVGGNCLPYRYTRSGAAGDDEVLAGAEPGDDELARCGRQHAERDEVVHRHGEVTVPANRQ
jgi:hypothetical protein